MAESARLDGASAATLRRLIRPTLPPEALRPQPARAAWFIPLCGFTIGAVAYLVTAQPAWPLALVLSLLVGAGFGSTYLLSHEVLHGAIFQSRRLQSVLGWVGLAPFLISPELWRTWHNQVHHGQANDDELDPDVFGTEDRFNSHRSTRVVARLAPGSGSILSAAFPFYWLTLHGQFVLWQLSTTMPGFGRLRRGRAIAETVVTTALWIALGVAIGWRGALLVILIPMAVANLVAMSYISTNHFLRPRGGELGPLRSSMSVRTWRWLDGLHFNFSHHVEHHLFPRMSGRYVGLVRTWLEQNAGEAYVCPGHWRALVSLYATPRISGEDGRLVDPWFRRAPVDPEELARELQS